LLSSARIKRLKSLHQKKFRHQENSFLLEGHRLIGQAISANTGIEEIWMTKKSLKATYGKNLIEQIEKKKYTLEHITK
tara:strand:+ start:265 stop:498 length:234 start_codon:yes stop_codon:yes gene_type:complete